MKINKVIIFLSFQSILLIGGLSAQTREYHIRSIEEQERIDAFGEKLVDLAYLNYPGFSIKDEEVAIAELEVKLSKYAWLDQLTVSANINESVIDPPSSDMVPNVYYPRYNFGVRIPVGIFVRQPTHTKIAKKMHQISLYNHEVSWMMLKKEVLSSYNDYLMYKEVYDLKIEIAEEAYAILMNMEDKFTNGEIELELYNNVAKNYKLDVEKLFAAKAEMENAKLELEMWIGRDLEDVN
ncbi:TolC family protein [Reichenbachiella ulvae]|uniref:TolC family protein n=1 Tax=Reichenbachiella ulvae TaxID=2980104 RepID=A0ABT3D148_9BACT|nr:TolC family protein [Reichenbachiella ulvae]MCV9389475.1 TolC family protein [Reichenbachiella ulvae]